MKINTSQVGFEAHEELQKALSVVDGSPFALEDMTSLVQRGPVKPGLLTSLLNANSNMEFMMTDTFKHDEENASGVLPTGKPYGQKGKDLPKDKARNIRWAIPSFGLRMNVAPQDYMGKRKPGTANELMDEAYVQAKMSTKAMDSWDKFKEYGLAYLLRTDTNLTLGGPFTAQNFYTGIIDTSLPVFQGVPSSRTTVNMQLTSGSVDHVVLFRQQRKQLEQDLARAGMSANGFVAVCGDNFFDNRYEIAKKEGMSRPLVSGTDLASEAVGVLKVNGLGYDTFKSEDGITYINYGSEILNGEKLIEDDKGYLFATGVENMIRLAFAPATTRTYVNTQALEFYAWTKVDEFQGVTTFEESNCLFAYTNPQLVRHMSRTA